MARRTGPGNRKAQALDAGLKSMFRKLEQRPAPQGLRDVVDQLDAGAEAAKPKPARN